MADVRHTSQTRGVTWGRVTTSGIRRRQGVLRGDV